MAFDLKPMTELEAVNLMLRGIQESPVSSLADNGVVDAVLARQVLHDTSRQVQERGWHFNTDRDFPLTPDVDGYVAVPADALFIDTSARSGSKDLIPRGSRLYDAEKHTFVIGETVYCDIVRFLAFEDLPQPARDYIAVSAARKFAEDAVGDANASRFNRDDELRAKARLENFDARLKGAKLSTTFRHI